MRFVKGGPDIPQALLDAQDAGRLVFFCGAGISRPAGLPDFSGLVDDVYQELHAEPDELEQSEKRKRAYERVFNLLERSHRFRAEEVRRVVAEILTVGPDADLDTHRALLQLASTRDGACRIVATNFDNCFELLKQESPFESDVSPRLNVPKRSTWKSLVYLHGLCSVDPRTVVLSSADYGRAYISEGWASRFIAELFREFLVVFVGYSLDDPPLRYLTDAMADDARRGDRPDTRPYALVAVKGKKESTYEQARREWRAKGVQPILYNQRNRHQPLHATLQNWAALHRKGLTGRVELVRSAARSMRPTGDELLVRQALELMQADTGPLTRAFAVAQPPATAEWLGLLDQYGLLQDEIKSNDGTVIAIVRLMGSALQFSPFLPLTSRLKALAPWIAGNLAQVELLRWALSQGGYVHRELKSAIARELAREKAEVPAVLKESWEVLITVDPPTYSDYRWMRPSLGVAVASLLSPYAKRRALLDALEPYIEFSPLPQKVDVRSGARLLDGDVRLAGERELHDVEQVVQREEVRGLCARLLPELTALLAKALDLLGLVTAKGDMHASAAYAVPDLRHADRHSGGWTKMLRFVTAGFTTSLKADTGTWALALAQFRLDSRPVFRRLTLWAYATVLPQHPHYAPEADAYLRAVPEGDFWRPWALSEQLQAFDALVQVSADAVSTTLWRKITAGPSQAYRRGFSSDEDFEQTRDHFVWQYLSLALIHNTTLPRAAQATKERIQAERGWPPEERAHVLRPRLRIESRWLEGEAPTVVQLESMDDAEAARVLAPYREAQDLRALGELAKKDDERAFRILERIDSGANAFDAAREAMLLSGPSPCSFAFLNRLVALKRLDCRDAGEAGLCAAVAMRLVEAAGTVTATDEAAFWHLWQDVGAWAQSVPASATGDCYHAVLNHPYGQRVQAAIKRLAAVKRRRGQGLEQEWKSRFNGLLAVSSPYRRLAAAAFCHALAYLYNVDPDWSQEHLLPLLDWSDPQTAQCAWSGFLYNAIVDQDLGAELAPMLSEACEHIAELSESRRVLMHLLVFLSLDPRELFRGSTVRPIVKDVEDEDRLHLLQWLHGRLKEQEPMGAWEKTVKPWLDEYWPRDEAYKTPRVTETFLRMAASVKGHLCEALSAVRAYTGQLPADARVWTDLIDSATTKEEAYCVLEALNAALPDVVVWWSARSLREELSCVAEQFPELRECAAYRALKEYLIRSGA